MPVAILAADRACADSTGLLGLGGHPAVTGRGVGVAAVDSGIAAHDALSGRGVANASFVPDDPSPADGFGHGTHIVSIIAGSGSPARSEAPAYGSCGETVTRAKPGSTTS
jgi:subtilisin family serine protease